MRRTVIIATIAISLGGCSSTYADSMRERGDQHDAIANQWDRGQELIDGGEAMVVRGRRMIDEGERMQASAEGRGAELGQ